MYNFAENSSFVSVAEEECSKVVQRLSSFAFGELFSQALDFVHKVRLQGLGAPEERRLLGIVIAAVVKYLCHVADELAELLVGLVVYS